MITCKKCGAWIGDNSTFCGTCGTPVEKTDNSYPYAGYAPVPSQPKNNAPIIIAIVASAIFVMFILIGVVIAVTSDDSGKDNHKQEIVVTEEEIAKEQEKAKELEITKKAPLKDFNSLINEYIDSRVPRGDLAVAVIDNVNNNIYRSTYSDSSYVAWGWYLPIYLTYTNQHSYSTSIANGIMSSDAGVCNQSANNAIRSFGGPKAITNCLQSQFGVVNTSYGRYFGDVNAVSENYTTPSEAAQFLQYLDRENGEGMLSYNIGSFGINKPYGVTVYAQVGTENRNVRKELNLYAVVKGYGTDYSIAIMSRNSAGVHITGLFDFINSEMEARANG